MKTAEPSSLENPKSIIQPVKVKPKEERKLFQETFDNGNFDLIYDSFRMPMTGLVKTNGEFIGIRRNGEMRKFEHTPVTLDIERDLQEQTRAHNAEKLDLRVNYHFNAHSGTLNDTLKYILCFYKGVSCYLQGKYLEAQKNYNHCFNLFEGDPQLFYNMGITLMMQGHFCQATLMFEETTRYDPHHPFVTNNLAYSFIVNKKYKEAVDACYDAFLINRGTKNYFRNWAIALMYEKRYAEALSVIKQAIDEEKHCAKNWLVCAEIYKRNGNFHTALSRYNDALLLDSKNSYALTEVSRLEALIDASQSSDLEDKIVQMSYEQSDTQSRSHRECGCVTF